MALFNYFLLINIHFLSLLFLILVTVIFLKSYKNRKRNLPPGPIGLPIVGYIQCLLSAPHKKFFEMRKCYGNIIGFWFGSRYYVLLNEYHIAKEVLNHTHALDRDPSLFSQVPFGFGILNGEEWVEQRRFSIQSLKNLGVGKEYFEKTTQDSVDIFIEDLKMLKAKPHDVTQMLHYFAINNIVPFVFGKKFDSIKEKDKLDFLIHYSDVFINEVQIFPLDLIIPYFSLICEYFGFSRYQGQRKTAAFAELFRNERNRQKFSADYKSERNFLNMYESKMLETKDKRKQHFFNEENFLGNTSQLFLGSTDTIFNSLCWILRFMVNYEDVQARVHKELDEVIGAEGSLNYENRFKVPYTFAVILESQRISSITPLGSPRWVREDIEIKGYTIPKGSIIITNLWGIHRDPDYWADPEKFMPERFLTNENQLRKNMPSYAAFSLGRRNCPGEFIALRTIFIFFTKLMQQFKISVPDDELTNFETDFGLLQCLKPQKLIFTERKYNVNDF